MMLGQSHVGVLSLRQPQPAGTSPFIKGSLSGSKHSSSGVDRVELVEVVSDDDDDDDQPTSGSSEVVVVSGDKASKFDTLHSVRYKLEHNQLSRGSEEVDKVGTFRVLSEHLKSEDWEVKAFALQLVHDILPHVGADHVDTCMAEVMPDLVPTLGSAKISIRKNAVQVLQIYLRLTSDVSIVLKAIVTYGLEHPDKYTVNEILIGIPLLFPRDFDERFCGPQRNLFYLVSGLARKLVPEETRLPAFMSLQKLADVVGAKQFQVNCILIGAPPRPNKTWQAI